MSPVYVAGTGPFEPKLMVVGEAPGKHEEEQGVPFVGPSGEMLDGYLKSAGVHRSEVYITNVVKTRPPGNDFKKLHLIGVDLAKSIQELWDNEINKLKPNCILAVGNEALRAVTNHDGIKNYRGSILTARNGQTKVVPTIHPAAIFSHFSQDTEEKLGGLDYVWTKLIAMDVARAVEESSTASINLPDRNLVTIHSSLDLFRYFREYQSLGKAACDIETINCIPVCIGFAFNRHHAISVPLLRQIGKAKLTDMGDNELDEVWRTVDEQLRRLRIVGHNFKYDDFKLGLCGFDIPNVYSDTLIKTRVLFPECPDKKLSTIASLWTREPFYKDEGKDFKLGKSPISQFLLYNAKDCAVDFEVDEEQEQDLIEMQDKYKVPLVDYYYKYMMKKHKFYLEMENNGLGVDFEKKKELKTRYTELEKEQHTKLAELVGHDVNVKSAPQMYQLLYKEMGFKPYKKAPTSEDSIVKLMQTHCKGKNDGIKIAILETVLEERRIRDQKSRYINFVPDYDRRCKTSFNISATETCRSSTSVLKKPVRPKKLGLAFHTISHHGRLAKDIRSMFVPDKGKIFIQLDSEQAEARVVATLCKNWKLLEAFDKIDIHRRTAGLIFGMIPFLDLEDHEVPIVDAIGKEDPMRFGGKKTRHAGNYDMQPPRFMTEFNTDAQKFGISMTISLWKAGNMLELFHAADPSIRNVFHTEVQEAIYNTRTLIDPFGGVRIFNGRMDRELFKEGYANIPQRTVGHLVQGAALKTREEMGDDIVPLWKSQKGGNWLSENHDSLLMQVPENNWEPYARCIQKHMTRPIDFSKYCTLKRDYQLVIPCSVEISDTNYAEMRKVKL